jgi:transposase-like protein
MKTALNDLYNAPDLKQTKLRKQQLIEQYQDQAAKAMALLDESFDEITAVYTLPEAYRKRLRTTNSIERLNKELRRRERMIRIFPNDDSLIRLMGAVLMEHHEKWTTGKKYFTMDRYLNVNERIKLYYGPSYGIRVISKKNEGTSITIRLPVITD